MSSDNGLWSASGQASGAGAQGLGSPLPSRYWQSLATNDALLCVFAAAEAVDTLALGYVNGVSGDTMRLRGADTEANLTAAPTYDSDNDHPSGITLWPAGADLSQYELHHRHFELDQVYTLGFWRIDFNFAANPDGFARVGRAMLGERIEPARPIAYPVTSGISEPVAEVVAFGGEESPRPRGAKRSVVATFPWTTEAEALKFARLLMWHGSHHDLLLVLDKAKDVAHMEHTFIGRVKDPQNVAITAFNRWAVTFGVHELAPIPMADQLV